jgi:hypothetical protein
MFEKFPVGSAITLQTSEKSDFQENSSELIENYFGNNKKCLITIDYVYRFV